MWAAIAVGVLAVAVAAVYYWEKGRAEDAVRVANDLLYGFRTAHQAGELPTCLSSWEALHEKLPDTYLFGLEVDGKPPGEVREGVAQKMRQRLGDAEHFHTLLAHLYTGRTTAADGEALLQACGLDETLERWKASVAHHAFCREQRLFRVVLPSEEEGQLLTLLQERFAGAAVLVAGETEGVGTIAARFEAGEQVEYVDEATLGDFGGPKTVMVTSQVDLVIDVETRTGQTSWDGGRRFVSSIADLPEELWDYELDDFEQVLREQALEQLAKARPVVYTE